MMLLPRSVRREIVFLDQSPVFEVVLELVGTVYSCILVRASADI
jgi:hypothetical protein